VTNHSREADTWNEADCFRPMVPRALAHQYTGPDQLVNEGAIAEQFIGQHLLELLAASPNRELTCWLREGRSANAEVDFVVAFEGRIIPLEVKSEL
jgi:predicted AAA+ superfamily ATPase